MKNIYLTIFVLILIYASSATEITNQITNSNQNKNNIIQKKQLENPTIMETPVLTLVCPLGFYKFDSNCYLQCPDELVADNYSQTCVLENSFVMHGSTQTTPIYFKIFSKSSCFNSCGLEFNDCTCDHSCKQKGNCCSDYIQSCNSILSLPSCTADDNCEKCVENNSSIISYADKFFRVDKQSNSTDTDSVNKISSDFRCLQCKHGFYLNAVTGKCEKQCQVNMMLFAKNNLCYPQTTIKNCLLEDKVSLMNASNSKESLESIQVDYLENIEYICKRCLYGFYLINNHCLSSCPTGFKADRKNFQCIDNKLLNNTDGNQISTVQPVFWIFPSRSCNHYCGHKDISGYDCSCEESCLRDGNCCVDFYKTCKNEVSLEKGKLCKTKIFSDDLIVCGECVDNAEIDFSNEDLNNNKKLNTNTRKQSQGYSVRVNCKCKDDFTYNIESDSCVPNLSKRKNDSNDSNSLKKNSKDSKNSKKLKNKSYSNTFDKHINKLRSVSSQLNNSSSENGIITADEIKDDGSSFDNDDFSNNDQDSVQNSIKSEDDNNSNYNDLKSNRKHHISIVEGNTNPKLNSKHIKNQNSHNIKRKIVKNTNSYNNITGSSFSFDGRKKRSDVNWKALKQLKQNQIKKESLQQLDNNYANQVHNNNDNQLSTSDQIDNIDDNEQNFQNNNDDVSFSKLITSSDSDNNYFDEEEKDKRKSTNIKNKKVNLRKKGQNQIIIDSSNFSLKHNNYYPSSLDQDSEEVKLTKKIKTSSNNNTVVNEPIDYFPDDNLNITSIGNSSYLNSNSTSSVNQINSNLMKVSNTDNSNISNTNKDNSSKYLVKDQLFKISEDSSLAQKIQDSTQKLLNQIHFGKNDKLTTINNFYLIDQSTALHDATNPNIFHTDSKNSTINFNLPNSENKLNSTNATGFENHDNEFELNDKVIIKTFNITVGASNFTASASTLPPISATSLSLPSVFPNVTTVLPSVPSVLVNTTTSSDLNNTNSTTLNASTLVIPISSTNATLTSSNTNTTNGISDSPSKSDSTSALVNNTSIISSSISTNTTSVNITN